ncbi:PI-PLC X domain-containing protein 3 [Fasciola gigantica]|uniref:PI-PLC X domain-containing protein 3 n=1 Tax=Fasciola gigantica TaxID=46835 RepID=A0A504YS97_FASGI|nr:PI-PLC X domain-containing protein 3 [Fasciola gigantica]
MGDVLSILYGRIDHRITHRKWMSELPGRITCQPLNQLAIPGTHNSFTYSIKQSSAVFPDAPGYDFFSQLPDFFGGMLIHNWAVTQDLSIREQLEAGIRYLDFRVGVDPNKGEFVLVHGQCAKPVEDELRVVAKFSKEYPREVILVDCNHCYEFKTSKQIHDFESLILRILGPIMIPPQDTVPSLDEIWQTNQRVIFFLDLHRSNPIQPDRLWPSRRVRSPWPKKTDASDLITFLNSRYGPKFPREPDRFFVHQGILTPDQYYVLLNPSGSVRELSHVAGKAFLDWLSAEERCAGPNGVNITLLDFAVSAFPDYVAKVLALNHKTWPASN